jgi:DNA-binding LacI/PurR family transcriptional regulator
LTRFRNSAIVAAELKRFNYMTTIKEVARRANVSIATVSYVLNGTGSVSAATRQAVLSAAAELQYRPSYRGRALQSQRSMTIGLALPSTRRVGDASFGELLAGITDGATHAGYHVLLAATRPDQREEELHAQLFRTGRIDGVVLLDVQTNDSRIAAARAEGMPYICAGQPGDDSPFIALDVVAGMVEAMAHLVVRGHIRIGLIQPPLEQTLAGEQEIGYRTALDEAGMAFEPELVVEAGMSEAEGYAAAEDLLSLPEPPTAIIAGTAALAFGVLHAIHDQGFVVGQDTALITFEDTPAAAHTSPPLTAVRQPLRSWGTALGKGLSEVMAGRAQPQEMVYPQLIVRRSCGE